MAAVPIVYSRPHGGAPAPTQGSISAKALKVLGASEEEVRFERAYVVSLDDDVLGAGRVFIECSAPAMSEAPASTGEARRWKPERVLGLAAEPPLTWLNRRSSESDAEARRSLPSKALAKLGATIDDVRIEKALLVLGEAPGREVPSGRLPRPPLAGLSESELLARIPTWAVAPPRPPTASRLSVFLLAFLPWGVLAPLNVLKLQLNKVSPGAHLWVPLETEQCQAACGVARMWASLFWSMQFANAVACLYLHANRERGLAMLAVSHKLVVGGFLVRTRTARGSISIRRCPPSTPAPVP